jgi:hypothetical protein
MQIRIRFRYGSRRPQKEALRRQVALMTASLMTPIAVMAWALAGWRLAADLKWTGDFAIQSGIFSRWQVWVALGILVQFGAFLLHRYGHSAAGPDDPALS